jgi:hypothetical protein
LQTLQGAPCIDVWHVRVVVVVFVVVVVINAPDPLYPSKIEPKKSNYNHQPPKQWLCVNAPPKLD